MNDISNLPNPMRWLIYFSIILFPFVLIIAVIGIYNMEQYSLISRIVLKSIIILIVILSILTVFRVAKPTKDNECEKDD